MELWPALDRPEHPPDGGQAADGRRAGGHVQYRAGAQLVQDLGRRRPQGEDHGGHDLQDGDGPEREPGVYHRVKLCVEITGFEQCLRLFCAGLAAAVILGCCWLLLVVHE